MRDIESGNNCADNIWEYVKHYPGKVPLPAPLMQKESPFFIPALEAFYFCRSVEKHAFWAAVLGNYERRISN